MSYQWERCPVLHLPESALTAEERKTPHEKFTAVLASVLSIDSKKIREIESQGKTETPSPHTKYSYDPEAPRD
jgi:hypothetical protein